MLRWVQAVAVLVTIGSAFWLYRQSYETRRLESAVTAEERRLERLQHDIAILEAERAYLSRPARIEPMARMLGLAPASPEQFGRP